MTQPYSFDFFNAGRRVCLVESSVNLTTPSVTITFVDAALNASEMMTIKRRPLNAATWATVATNVPAGTTTWVDNSVSLGETWEYQVRRTNTWSYGGVDYDAIGYTIGVLGVDNTNYKGRMILLVANTITTNLATKYLKLKKELTADGWYVEEIITPQAAGWNSGDTVVGIRSQIQTIYANAPTTDKPKVLFILGHVPMPRSGSSTATAPDAHDENKGARGCDAYYADIDGIYTDVATFDPGGLEIDAAINYPGDYKWDQDFFPSDVELAFGRVDFKDLDNPDEIGLTENYLDRLSAYKNVLPGYKMGDKSGFYLGYENSHDGTYRSLLNISKSANILQNAAGADHPQWVQANGPFKIYMQNQQIPENTSWDTYGMNATVFSSDQSYWGWGDESEVTTIFGLIRSLLSKNTKCLVTLWTTTGLNIFHQSCTGQPFGIAMKEIMNHNQVNQKLEKAQQSYDTQEWWNRTHFEYWGDPTINLYQLEPPANPTLTQVGSTMSLSWVASTGSSILGYNVYVSDSELGVFTKLNTTPITTTNYTIVDYQTGKWYMVKAIAMLESGCGKFVQPSLGVSVMATMPIIVGLFDTTELIDNSITIQPNPVKDEVTISTYLATDSEILLVTAKGEYVETHRLNPTKTTINIGHLAAGVYFAKVGNKSAKVIKL